MFGSNRGHNSFHNNIGTCIGISEQKYRRFYYKNIGIYNNILDRFDHSCNVSKL